MMKLHFKCRTRRPAQHKRAPKNNFLTKSSQSVSQVWPQPPKRLRPLTVAIFTRTDTEKLHFAPHLSAAFLASRRRRRRHSLSFQSLPSSYMGWTVGGSVQYILPLQKKVLQLKIHYHNQTHANHSGIAGTVG